ncbi:MAG: ActS/PrrB/RegB family redox-sensitive histidine kinase, partial [Notoacmeibacter sp.]
MIERLLASHENRRAVRLSTLIRLRWLAVTGQILAIGIVAFGLGFAMPVAECLVLVAASALLNVVLSLRFPLTHRLRPAKAALLLAYDVGQLTILLLLTGGLQNPFAILIIVPVVIAAGALPVVFTGVLSALTAAFTILLAFVHLPLPWFDNSVLELPSILVAGIAAAILSTMAFAAIYASRVAREARELSDALAATELVLQREQHLSAIDGLAAATAHELGTPLGTIAVIAKEMERTLGKDDRFREDVGLLRSQSERCRDILRRLTSLSAESEAHMLQMPLTTLIEDAVAPHREFGIEIEMQAGAVAGVEPVARRNPGLIYSIGNLVENAVDFAKSRVVVAWSWSQTDVTLTITDDGLGFSPSIIDRIGDPYASDRSTRDGKDLDKGGGLGLGLFIAKTLIERSGAQISFRNANVSNLGAEVRIF